VAVLYKWMAIQLTLTILGTLIEQNKVNAYGSAVFFLPTTTREIYELTIPQSTIT